MCRWHRRLSEWYSTEIQFMPSHCILGKHSQRMSHTFSTTQSYQHNVEKLQFTRSAASQPVYGFVVVFVHILIWQSNTNNISLRMLYWCIMIPIIIAAMDRISVPVQFNSRYVSGSGQCMLHRKMPCMPQISFRKMEILCFIVSLFFITNLSTKTIHCN